MQIWNISWPFWNWSNNTLATIHEDAMKRLTVKKNPKPEHYRQVYVIKVNWPGNAKPHGIIFFSQNIFSIQLTRHDLAWHRIRPYPTWILCYKNLKFELTWNEKRNISIKLLEIWWQRMHSIKFWISKNEMLIFHLGRYFPPPSPWKTIDFWMTRFFVSDNWSISVMAIVSI